MARLTANDLDYLGARLHGRRSRMAEGGFLDTLCRLQNIPELGRAVFPGVDLQTCAQFQRRAVEELAEELSRCREHLDARGANLLTWLLVRFQGENLKVLLRAYLNHTPIEKVQEHLLKLPHDIYAFDARSMLAATSLEVFANLLPAGELRGGLINALRSHHEYSRPFFVEAALDRIFFHELLTRCVSLGAEDKEAVAPLLNQEANLFQLMLVLRGRFQHGISPALLRPLYLRGCGLSVGKYDAMLQAPDVGAMACIAVGGVVDGASLTAATAELTTPLDATQLETLAWNRYLMLANTAFRRSHMGLAAVVGYIGLRRVEVANLISISEGIRMGVPPDVIRNRLIPRRVWEVVHV